MKVTSKNGTGYTWLQHVNYGTIMKLLLVFQSRKQKLRWCIVAIYGFILFLLDDVYNYFGLGISVNTTTSKKRKYWQKVHCVCFISAKRYARRDTQTHAQICIYICVSVSVLFFICVCACSIKNDCVSSELVLLRFMVHIRAHLNKHENLLTSIRNILINKLISPTATCKRKKKFLPTSALNVAIMYWSHSEIKNISTTQQVTLVCNSIAQIL